MTNVKLMAFNVSGRDARDPSDNLIAWTVWRRWSSSSMKFPRLVADDPVSSSRSFRAEEAVTRR